METIFREEYLQGDQPSLQTIFLTIIHIGHTSILCRFTPWHTSLCFNDFLLQDFASLLQWHCKAVAVLLQIYVQCYCKPFAAPLQKACSVFAVGSVCVSVINFFYLREVSEQPVRDSSANMFRQSGRNSHFCFDGLIYICIAHGIGHVVRLMGKEAESCLSIA